MTMYIDTIYGTKLEPQIKSLWEFELEFRAGVKDA